MQSQISSKLPTLARFVRELRINHRHTPGRPALPLHYDTQTHALVEFPWYVTLSFLESLGILKCSPRPLALPRPCDPESGERIPPSMLEEHQRTHHFWAPCCFCTFLGEEGGRYTESVIGVVEDARLASGEVQPECYLNGQYVALCAERRCGYFRQ